MDPQKFTNEEEALIGKISQSAMGIVLSAEEKSKIKGGIISHIESGLVSSTFGETKTRKSSITVHDFFGLSRQIYIMPALVLLLVFLGTGTSYYAQSSLPGDTLYGVKTGINENVESLLAMTPESQADVNLKQVSARLDEVEALSSSGSLTEVQTVTVQNNFSKKVQALNKSIDKVKKKGNTKKAEKVTQDFDREIDDHFDAFVTISNSASNSPTFASIFTSKKSRSGDNGIIMMSSVRVATPTSKQKEIEKDHGLDDDEGDNDEDEDKDDDDRGEVVTPPVVSPTSTTTTTVTPPTPTIASYTLVQVAVHNKSTDCWSIVSGGVYNLTSWIAQHPGGQEAIKSMCGVDATAGFLAQHKGQSKPTSTIASYKIGILK
ncbi:MAG: fatty acid desaturase 2-like [Parcubacteria group bacterium Gr01-1014_46]|nr:MAG: fatty acid desaturase 2-like [Parcubacteria group bacterium Gr01-1014_46]